MKKKRFDRIIASLILVLLAIWTGPWLPGASQNLEWIIGGCLALLAALAIIKKSWFDAGLGITLLAALIAGRLQFNQIDSITYMIRFGAIGAFTLLHLALFVGPWSRLVKSWSKIYKHRRHLGVTAFLLADLHASLVLKVYYSYNFEAAYSSIFVFFGFTSLFIMAWLAISSWDKVQHSIKNKWWSIIHGSLLLIYVGAIFYARSTALDISAWHQWLLLAFVAFWLLTSPWALPKLMLKRVNGWKQLHVLIYIAYVSLIVHSWTGVVKLLEITWLSALFWTMVVAVVTSHSVGLIVKSLGGKKEKTPKPVEIEGKKYSPTAAVGSFENGIGQRFKIDGSPVAVFKDGDKFIAMSAVCPHQGGPIDQGKIVNGFVECPWHQYQFGVDDGLGPEGYKDCIPYFPVTVREGVVYVAAEDTGACCLKDGHYKQCE